MADIRIIGENLSNMPWQDKPADCVTPVWRYSENPVIGRNPLPNVARIFNSAVLPYEDGFIGVFRGEQRDGIPHIYLGRSKDAVHWEFDPEKIPFTDKNGEPFMPKYAYDPRLVKVEDTYYIMWCQDMFGPTIGVAVTKDFRTFTRVENPFLPYNRNAVLFPRKINGKYVMMSRPSDSGHTPFGDIYISQSPDLTYWGEHRHVMGPSKGWESTKIGAGPIPIETERGWLIFYHGVLTSCNGYVYSFSAALLDKDKPWKVLKRGSEYLINPREIYETVGDVQNVTFPCANLVDGATGRIAIYYGCADTCTSLCFTTVDDVMDFLDTHSQV